MIAVLFFCALFYYIIVMIGFFSGAYYNKSIFLIDLVPFAGVVRIAIDKWRDLV